MNQNAVAVVGISCRVPGADDARAFWRLLRDGVDAIADVPADRRYPDVPELAQYSRGGFVRSFALDESVDPALIQARYVDGVLQVSLPMAPGKERVSHEIPVN